MTNEYVAAAYGVILFGLLMYVVAVGLKSARMAREAELLALLVERADDDVRGAGPDSDSDSDSETVDAPDPASRA